MKICLVSASLSNLRGGVADHTVLLEQTLSEAARVFRWEEPPVDRRTVSGAVQRITDEKCDAAIVQYTPNLYGWRSLFPALLLSALKKKGVPTLTLFHEIFMPFYPGLLRNLTVRPYNFAKDFWCLKATRIPVVTFTRRARDIERRFGVACRVVPAFSNLPPFDGPPPPKKFLLGTFGTYHGDADLGCLLRALESFPGARARFVGQAPPRWAGEAGRFTGYLPPREASQALQEIQYFVVPDRRGISFRKGSAAAALAAGLTVIATRTGWTDDAFRHGENVFFFDGTPRGLVEAVRALEADPGLARAVALGGRALYQSRMSREAAARALLQWLSEAA